jgi:hypothetical protein
MAVVPIVSLLPRSPAASGNARQTRRDEDAYASVPPGQLGCEGQNSGCEASSRRSHIFQGSFC